MHGSMTALLIYELLDQCFPLELRLHPKTGGHCLVALLWSFSIGQLCPYRRDEVVVLQLNRVKGDERRSIVFDRSDLTITSSRIFISFLFLFFFSFLFIYLFFFWLIDLKRIFASHDYYTKRERRLSEGY